MKCYGNTSPGTLLTQFLFQSILFTAQLWHEKQTPLTVTMLEQRGSRWPGLDNTGAWSVSTPWWGCSEEDRSDESSEKWPESKHEEESDFTSHSALFSGLDDAGEDVDVDDDDHSSRGSTKSLWNLSISVCAMMFLISASLFSDSLCSSLSLLSFFFLLGVSGVSILLISDLQESLCFWWLSCLLASHDVKDLYERSVTVLSPRIISQIIFKICSELFSLVCDCDEALVMTDQQWPDDCNCRLIREGYSPLSTCCQHWILSVSDDGVAPGNSDH